MKINKITKSLSIMLTLCMLFSLAPALGTTAMATGSSTVLSESFDAGTLPAGWTLQSSGNTSFFIAQNFGNASSAAAHGGAGYSAFCRGVAYSYNTSYLITPAINLPDAVTIDVSFYYINPVWDSDANQPSVCWSTSAEGPWTLLWSSTTDESGAYTAPGSTNKTAAKNAAVENWTQVEVDLSGLSGTIYLAFGSCDGYGYGVGYDDIAVTAETTLINYNVWIGGTRVTNANRKNILNSTGKPAAAYTPTDGSSPARLALNNAAITAVSENGATYGIYSTEDLNIEVTGTNTVTASGDTGTTSGIAVLDAEVARACTFTGSGTLTVTSSDTKAEKTGDLCTGIKSGSLTVQSDLTLSFAAGDSGTSYGISTDSLTINEGRVTAQGMTSAVSTAPVLTGYARAYAVTASTSYDGAAPAASYNEAPIGTYKYPVPLQSHAEPFLASPSIYAL